MRILGHATLQAADLSIAEKALPKSASWPRWLLLGAIVVVILRLTLKDLEMGWSRALQIYFFSILSFLLGLSFGLGRWLTARPTPEQVMARLGLVTDVLTLELDEHGLVYGAHARRAWTDFHSVSEVDGAFILRGDDALLHVIPKRAFTLAELQDVRGLMLAHIKT